MLAYSWKGIYVSVLHEVFIKTRRENVDLPHAKKDETVHSIVAKITMR